MKKGFTLIELLAVIIILAIIALIATPIILNVVEDARISAGKSEAQMIYSGINNYCASSMMEEQLNGKVDICADGVTTEEVSQMVNLGNAIVNKVTYSNGKVTELEVESNNHIFRLCGDGSFVMDDEECGVTPPDVGLVGDAISETVLEKYPYLATTGNGCTTSNENNYSYMGGCYLKGNPTDNYLWYSGFLWRIMGINADGSVRLITDENVTGISYHESSSNWDGSHAKDWLNNYFYPRLKGNDIIVEQTWCSETTTSSSSARTSCSNNLSTEKAKVGSISLDEYNLAGAGNSYLNIGQYQWTLTPYNGSYAWDVGYNGNSINDGVNDGVRDAYGLRAVINVNSNVTITGGNGTLGETWSSEAGPYILNEDKSIEVTGKLNEKATSGEYVLYAGKKYRIVYKDSNGNTKLILDGYYEKNDSVYEMEYGDNNTFSTTTGIGQKLNSDVLEWLVASSDTENRNKLVTNYTWYQNEFDGGDNYTISLEETNPTRSINATVGLIRVGEMLSSQSSSILTKGYTTTSSYNNANTYWTMTPSSSSSGAWFVDGVGSSNGNYRVSNASGLRAVIVVNSNVTITGGNGTWSSPYEI